MTSPSSQPRQTPLTPLSIESFSQSSWESQAWAQGTRLMELQSLAHNVGGDACVKWAHDRADKSPYALAYWLEQAIAHAGLGEFESRV